MQFSLCKSLKKALKVNTEIKWKFETRKIPSPLVCHFSQWLDKIMWQAAVAFWHVLFHGKTNIDLEMCITAGSGDTFSTIYD